MDVSIGGVFDAVAHKQLVRVDLPKKGSNQHEFNGITALKELFRPSGLIRGTISWHYFADDHDPADEEGAFTFYDARAKSVDRTGRSEWRFYYYGEFLTRADVGDWLVLARANSGKLFALIFQNNSAWLRAAQVLFGIEKLEQDFRTLSQPDLDSRRLELLRLEILEELGLDLKIPASPTDEDLVVRHFQGQFPSTKLMSAFARAHAGEYIPNQPDQTLVRWLEREEQLFRALENVLIRTRLDKGFATVDEFIDFSLSVQNRRKSRMGHALQNHLAELFTHERLRYTPQAHTEGTSRPDFIFPGESEYHDSQFNTNLLVMLGVKSSCKDRWRQVLTEADRISVKHLCTLEAGISLRQTEEMHRQSVVLVVPASLHLTYAAIQRPALQTVSKFVELVRAKQS